MPEKKCFLCNRDCNCVPWWPSQIPGGTSEHYECPSCGCFSVLLSDAAELQNNNDFMEKAKYLACERKLKGKDFQDYILHSHPLESIQKLKTNSGYHNLKFIHWDEFIRDFPKNHEIPGRALINLGNAIKFGYPINLSDNSDESTFPSELLFAKKSSFSKAFELVLNTLKNEKLIEYDIPQTTPKTYDVSIIVTPDGWSRIARLREKRVDSKQIFVAMWFDETQNETWEKGIIPGIEGEKDLEGREIIPDTGYKAKRIDKWEHNNKICDEIIAEIRKSRALVADFTGQRGGVYYEAGFAMGLNIPVIWIVHKNDIDKLHFDTRQYSHIVYENSEDLKRKLNNRIKATAI